MLIIRGLADSFVDGCKNPKSGMSGQLLPLIIRKSATVRVNYSLTITLFMVLKEAVTTASFHLL
jgi:hypothetical protein